MLGKFWNRGGTASSKRLDAVDSRGLEVVDDDPQTAWSLWDNALAEQDSRYGGLPPLSRNHSTGKIETNSAAAAFNFDFDDTPTCPMPLGELSNEQRAHQALDVVDHFHQRIASNIRTFWGHKECPIYINKLILEGGDRMGSARSGFNPETVKALMELSDLHEAIFGPMEPQGSGFARL